MRVHKRSEGVVANRDGRHGADVLKDGTMLPQFTELRMQGETNVMFLAWSDIGGQWSIIRERKFHGRTLRHARATSWCSHADSYRAPSRLIWTSSFKRGHGGPRVPQRHSVQAIPETCPAASALF